MFRNHFLIALRNFRKKKAFTGINIFGLTIGMTVALLILIYARYELSYDRFHPDADLIYRVSVDLYDDGKFQAADAQCYPAVGPMAIEEFPEIADYGMARHVGRILLRKDQTAFNEDRMYFADPGWLRVFDWQMIHGDRETALSKPDQVVLTESAARKYFGDQNPVGEMIELLPGGGKVSVMVTGVVKDVPENAHLHFDVLVSWESGVKYMDWKLDNWNGNNEFMYLKAKNELDTEFEDRFNATFYKRTEYEAEDERLKVYPLTDIHLKSDRTYEAESNGSQATVNILLMVSVFILAIAWVNYINLATARAMERGKEVGVRKVLGSTRRALMVQFLTEAVLINLLALILTVTSIQGVLPLFNRLAGTALVFDLFSDTQLIWQLGLLFVVGTLASGFYPSLVLSGYKPLAVLTGKLKTSSKGLLLRKSLVIFQFAATMFLLVGTITVYRQVNFMRQQDLGVDLEQTVVINAPIVEGENEQMNQWRSTFKTEAERLSQVQQVTFSGTVFGQPITDMNSTNGVKAVSTEMGDGATFYFYYIDESYVPTFDLELLAGRNFEKNSEVPNEEGDFFYSMLINETSRKLLGFASAGEAVGEKVQLGKNQFTVVGVMADHNHNSLKSKVFPMFYLLDHDGSGADFFSVKMRSGAGNGESYKAVLSSLESVFRSVYPGSDFDYYFLDERFNEQYQADQQFGIVFSTFSGLSVLISILGLFGLGLYEIQQRIKEIGIRKVLGASVSGIIQLLTQHFLRLILISVVIALPLAYFGMDQWLNGYAYRIGLNWVLFVVPAILILFIALATVIGQTIKVARKNPVEALRYE